jgi:NitT/TauT family transport system substrate-binding protein
LAERAEWKRIGLTPRGRRAAHRVDDRHMISVVQDLVNYVLGAGAWLDEQQENRNKAVAIAAGPKYFNQDPNIIRFVMENPTDRVTYGDLRMIRDEFDELMQLSIEAGTLNHPVPYEKYVDESFAQAVHPAMVGL